VLHIIPVCMQFVFASPYWFMLLMDEFEYFLVCGELYCTVLAGSKYPLVHTDMLMCRCMIVTQLLPWMIWLKWLAFYLWTRDCVWCLRKWRMKGPSFTTNLDLLFRGCMLCLSESCNTTILSCNLLCTVHQVLHVSERLYFYGIWWLGVSFIWGGGGGGGKRKIFIVLFYTKSHTILCATIFSN
jgi:hypothetical protein